MWYRSWPETIPEGRAHVVDGLPRLLMRDCDYATLPDYQPWPIEAPGFFLLEWDMALDRVGRDRFAGHALAEPARVMVAPYVKPLPQWDAGTVATVAKQVHRVQGRPVADGTPECETFGFGCIYLPQSVLTAWLASERFNALKGVFTDIGFSSWHRDFRGGCPIDWTVHPQHLHGD